LWPRCDSASAKRIAEMVVPLLFMLKVSFTSVITIRNLTPLSFLAAFTFNFSNTKRKPSTKITHCEHLYTAFIIFILAEKLSRATQYFFHF